MAGESIQTTELHAYLNRIKSGDEQAKEELLKAVFVRIEWIARKMLRDFPGIKRWEETGDVLNTALMKLMRSLPEVSPKTMRDFYSLAAVQIRRTLLDLVKHYQGPMGHGKNLQSFPAQDGSQAAQHDPMAPDYAVDLEKWSQLHEEVENLPTDEREVFSLTFYHGLTQIEIGELLGIDERTVRRKWQKSCLRIGEKFQSDMPDLIS